MKKSRCWYRTSLPGFILALLLAASADGATLTVNSIADDGTGTCTVSKCTLRDAIASASAVSSDTITFSLPANSTITLTSDELLINKNLIINGPGANLLTVQRSTAPGTPAFRIFNIASGITTISGLTIANGNAPSAGGLGGGGIHNGGGTLTITNSAISGNSLSVGNTSPGGGISNIGTLTITNSTISGNSTDGPGGGIFNSPQGTVTITNSAISGNSTRTSSGGGINSFSNSFTITNSTISGNSADAQAGGGTFGPVTVTNCTISGNSAGSSGGGGIWSGGGTVTARNTIVALNTSAGSSPDVFGAVTSQGFNLIGNNDGAFITPTQSSDQIGTPGSPIDPLLDSLQDNGGPTFTRALRTGSPAIDKGHSSGSSTDQRGFTRPVDLPNITNVSGGDGGDIGAFEVQAPTPTILANISTRLLVETGDNVLIGGFIITGTQPKKVIVRALGPSLPLAGKLANPVLELHGPGAFATITNDNWRSDQEAEIIATGIPPTNDLESAIVATLPANGAGYTAIVRGVNNGTGIGVVEAYDLDHTVDSKLGNIATRGLVQTGDNVLIAGTIVLGQTSQNVIILALGPSLGVPGELADPTLELRDANGGLIRSNDNWRSDQEAEIIATGIPPSNDLESAIVALLPANGALYTAIVRGVNGTTGVAVVEVFAIN